jgi:hypothetical protein
MKKFFSYQIQVCGLLITLLLFCPLALGQENSWRMIGSKSSVQANPDPDGTSLEVVMARGAQAWIWREDVGSLEITGPARVRLSETIDVDHGKFLFTSSLVDSNPILLSFADRLEVAIRGEVWAFVEETGELITVLYFPSQPQFQPVADQQPPNDSDSNANQHSMGWKWENGSWGRIVIDSGFWKRKVSEVAYSARQEWRPLRVDLLPGEQDEQTARGDGEESQNTDTETGGGGDAALCMDPSGEGNSAGDINQDPEGVVIEPGMSRVRLEIRWEE